MSQDWEYGCHESMPFQTLVWHGGVREKAYMLSLRVTRDPELRCYWRTICSETLKTRDQRYEEPNTETEGSEDNLDFLDGRQGRDRADGFASTQRQRGPKETVGLSEDTVLRERYCWDRTLERVKWIWHVKAQG